MLVMYDSIEPGQIPAHAAAVAGYVGGRWPTYKQLLRDFPKAHHLSIAINAGEDADCLDIEAGDASPADAHGWWTRQHARGISRPALYADLSTMPEVHADLQASGVQRGEYRSWVAHFTDQPHIPPGEDGCQWTQKALGRNLDESLLTDTFFAPLTVPSLYVPADEARWIREYDQLGHRRDPWATVRRRALQRRIRDRILEILQRVHNEGPASWEIRNRENRYKQLLARA